MQIESMTGFGSYEKGGFRVEARSVNHKNLDVNFNGPPYLLRLDPDIRKSVKSRFDRGRIDIYVSSLHDSRRKITVNAGLARQYRDAVGALKKELKLKDEAGLDFFLSLKGVFSSNEPNMNERDIAGAVEHALLKLKTSRRREGKALVAEVANRMHAVNRLVLSIEARRKEIVSNSAASLREKIKNILGDTPLDEARLIQETAIIIERSDITEELVRIKSHLSYMRDILKSGGTVGKKLDFVLQELKREINTIGSKSADVGLAVTVVEIKDELEKMKEQVQNLQ